MFSDVCVVSSGWGYLKCGCPNRGNELKAPRNILTIWHLVIFGTDPPCQKESTDLLVYVLHVSQPFGIKAIYGLARQFLFLTFWPGRIFFKF